MVFGVVRPQHTLLSSVSKEKTAKEFSIRQIYGLNSCSWRDGFGLLGAW
jgi:hypothetical protein